MVRTHLIALGLAASAGLAQAGSVYNSGPMDFTTQVRQSIWGPGNATIFQDTKLLAMDVSGSASAGTIIGSNSARNPLWTAWKLCKDTVNVLCGSEPSKTIDTRTGAKVGASTSGKVGAEVGYKFDGGSVGAQMQFDAQALVPDQGEVGKGEAFNLNPNSTWRSGSIDTQSPTAEAFANAYVDLDLSVSGQACAIGFGCTGKGSTKIIDTGVKRQEIVGIDPNEIKYLDGFVPGVDISTALLNQTASVEVGISPPAVPKVQLTVTETKPDGTKQKKTIGPAIPVGISVDVAEAEIKFPIATGQASLKNGMIDLDTQADFVSVKADADTLLPILPPGGLNVQLGPLSVSANAYDLKVGPKMDVFQDFLLKSKLHVDLMFDRDVEVVGQGLARSWSGLWDSLPDFKVFGKTVFTPVYKVVSQLTNQTGLTFGFEATAKLFELTAGIGIGPISISSTLGPLFEKSIPFASDFAQVSIFDKTFDMTGYNTVQGAAFVVNPNPVPLPFGGTLLASGLGLLAVIRRRRQVLA